MAGHTTLIPDLVAFVPPLPFTHCPPPQPVRLRHVRVHVDLGASFEADPTSAAPARVREQEDGIGGVEARGGRSGHEGTVEGKYGLGGLVVDADVERRVRWRVGFGG